MNIWNDDDHESLNDMLYDRYAKDNSAVWFVVIVTLALILVGGVVASLFIGEAKAHDWYEIECCDTRDCRPISGMKDGVAWSEIQDMGTHYLWTSAISGKTHKIPSGDPRVRSSRDGFFHGCEVTGDIPPDSHARCLYVPVMF